MRYLGYWVGIPLSHTNGTDLSVKLARLIKISQAFLLSSLMEYPSGLHYDLSTRHSYHHGHYHNHQCCTSTGLSNCTGQMNRTNSPSAENIPLASCLWLSCRKQTDSGSSLYILVHSCMILYHLKVCVSLWKEAQNIAKCNTIDVAFSCFCSQLT